jgi:hypothetical protein
MRNRQAIGYFLLPSAESLPEFSGPLDCDLLEGSLSVHQARQVALEIGTGVGILAMLSPSQLRKSASNYIPKLSEERLIRRRVLDLLGLRPLIFWPIPPISRLSQLTTNRTPPPKKEELGFADPHDGLAVVIQNRT